MKNKSILNKNIKNIYKNEIKLKVVFSALHFFLAQRKVVYSKHLIFCTLKNTLIFM